MTKARMAAEGWQSWYSRPSRWEVPTIPPWRTLFQRLFVGVLAAALVSTIAPADELESGERAETLFAVGEVRGSGRWAAAARAAGATQRWDIDLEREEGGAVSGRVALRDSPLMKTGNLAGRVVGRRISGTITDDAGLFVASFSGRLTGAGGLRGTYHDRTGEVGEWEWDGPLPR